MNKAAYIFALIFLIVCLLVVMLDIYANQVFYSLSENVIRLHVVANSNYANDQNLKLSVRDSVIEYLSKLNSGCPVYDHDVIATEDVILSHLEKINEIAQKTVSDNGYDYITKATYGTFYFPIKKYDNFVLPSGMYTALKIDIGESMGDNWWCVLYPPLCFPEGSYRATGTANMELFVQAISEKNAKVVFLNRSGEICFRFKIVEFFQSIKKAKLE